MGKYLRVMNIRKRSKMHSIPATISSVFGTWHLETLTLVLTEQTVLEQVEQPKVYEFLDPQ